VNAFGLALAFPRTDWEAVAWFVLAPLFVTALAASPRAALGWGWLYGTVFFLVLLRWLDHTFRVYSAIPWPVTMLPMLALAAYCGLWIGLVAWALAWLGRRSTPAVALLAAPFLWVAAEWLRGRLLGGFPWGSLGYSQYLQLPLIQVAELAGVHAVSFLVAAVNAALAGCLALGWRGALTGVAAAVLLVGGALGFGQTRLAAPLPPAEVSVALIQPSIEQPLKFDPNHAANTLAIYSTLSRRAGVDRPDLIVWPETALPAPLRREPVLQAGLTELARALGAPLLVGSLDVEGTSPPVYRNSAFLLSERGVIGRYDKIHLVPFGEFVPLPGVIGFVRSWAEFISELEPGSRRTVFTGPPTPFGVVICYEGIFPALVRDFVNGGARLLVNMTNDGWFGRTSGPWQHLAMYPFRAVEHRTAVVRAANTGVSAFIAPSGQIIRRTRLYERVTLAERLPLRRGLTLYARLGDWLAWVALVVSGGALAVGWRRGRAA
jgi:apolipoprotein N-acyltransferase